MRIIRAMKLCSFSPSEVLRACASVRLERSLARSGDACKSSVASRPRPSPIRKVFAQSRLRMLKSEKTPKRTLFDCPVLLDGQTVTMGSLIAPDHFTHILRVLNTNVDGKNKIMYAMTNIRGIGRRFSNFACKKGEVDMRKRAGECSAEDIENLMLITSNPRAYKTPDWFLNRQKDIKDGSYSQVTASALDNKWREDFERLKKARVHRGLRHFWGLRVKGQHTKTTGRRGARMAMLAKQAGRK